MSSQKAPTDQKLGKDHSKPENASDPSWMESSFLSSIELSAVGLGPMIQGDCVHLRMRLKDQRGRAYVPKKELSFDLEFPGEFAQPTINIDCVGDARASHLVKIDQGQAERDLFFYAEEAGQYEFLISSLDQDLVHTISLEVLPMGLSQDKTRSLRMSNDLSWIDVTLMGPQNQSIGRGRCLPLEVQIADRRKTQDGTAPLHSPSTRLSFKAQDIHEDVFFEDQDCNLALAGGQDVLILPANTQESIVYLWIPDSYSEKRLGIELEYRPLRVRSDESTQKRKFSFLISNS
ncbi:MAG: hypothetical protein KDD52_01885 [Bdellovibrionales bacterium]|nr:hypothetical protein [Bdellovibrionales bacterium]